MFKYINTKDIIDKIDTTFVGKNYILGVDYISDLGLDVETSISEEAVRKMFNLAKDTAKKLYLQPELTQSEERAARLFELVTGIKIGSTTQIAVRSKRLHSGYSYILNIPDNDGPNYVDTHVFLYLNGKSVGNICVRILANSAPLLDKLTQLYLTVRDNEEEVWRIGNWFPDFATTDSGRADVWKDIEHLARLNSNNKPPIAIETPKTGSTWSLHIAKDRLPPYDREFTVSFDTPIDWGWTPDVWTTKSS